MVWRTFSWVAGRTRGLPCSTSETVDFDTPAACATSMIVTRLRPPGSMLSAPSLADLPSAPLGTFQNIDASCPLWAAQSMGNALEFLERSDMNEPTVREVAMTLSLNL